MPDPPRKILPIIFPKSPVQNRSPSPPTFTKSFLPWLVGSALTWPDAAFAGGTTSFYYQTRAALLRGAMINARRPDNAHRCRAGAFAGARSVRTHGLTDLDSAKSLKKPAFGDRRG